MLMLSIMVFAGALAVSLGVIAHAVGPQWQRIVRLAMGQVEQRFEPLQTLATAERRIAVRRWASAPVPVSIQMLRAAA